MGEQIFSYIIQALVGVYVFLLLLRFLLQFSKADFYNPMSQMVVKATQPVTLFLRRIMPAWGGFDSASLMAAWLILYLQCWLIVALYGADPTFLAIKFIVWSFLALISLLINLLFWALIITALLSWITSQPNAAAALVVQITEPMLAFFRRFIPPIGGLDLSVLVAIMVLQLIDHFALGFIAVQMGMLPLGQIIFPFLF